mmetsp:Transcript_8644/g.12508  ORF Transcript_8644/g.12508 Transcript_8644/m.12508 type:complete len:131 (+) Transcript_8644:648-1040(+)
MAEEQAPPNTTASLNWKKYLNVLALILNCVIIFGIGNFGSIKAITERFGDLVVAYVLMVALVISFIIVVKVVERVALLCVPSCAINQRLTTTAAADGEGSSKKEQPAATRSIDKTPSNASVYSNNVESSV